MSFPVEARKNVIRNGGRLTKTRELVIDLLAGERRPMNAYEIAEIAMSRGEKLDVSTAYRVLEAFEKYGVVHFLKGEQKYVACQEIECENSDHCHHEFVCEDCGKASEVHIEDGDFLAKIQKKYEGLKIRGHYLELSGICGDCL